MTTTDKPNNELTEEEKKLVEELQSKLDEASQDENVLFIDQTDFTIDEIDEIENIIDDSIDALEDVHYKKANAMRAMAYVVMKRTDPDFKIADAGKLKPHFRRTQQNPTKSADS